MSEIFGNPFAAAVASGEESNYKMSADPPRRTTPPGRKWVRCLRNRLEWCLRVVRARDREPGVNYASSQNREYAAEAGLLQA